MSKRRILAMAALCCLLSGQATPEPIALEAYNGYWSGLGTVVMSSGSTEQVKCVVTYRTGGDQVKQNLRCARASYSINGAAELQVRGGQVTGTWEEKTYSAVGTVTGKSVPDGMIVAIDSINFSAAMTVSVAGCKQAIAIQPKGLDVTRITLALAKC